MNRHVCTSTCGERTYNLGKTVEKSIIKLYEVEDLGYELKREVWGVGGMLPDFFFCSFFPGQQTTSGIGQVVFSCEKQRPPDWGMLRRSRCVQIFHNLLVSSYLQACVRVPVGYVRIISKKQSNRVS